MKEIWNDDGCWPYIMVDVLRLSRLLLDIEDARWSVKVDFSTFNKMIQIVTLSLLIESSFDAIQM